MSEEKKQTESKTPRGVFVEWCWSSALPVVGAALVPMILATIVGSVSAHSAAQEAAKDALKDQNAQIQQLQLADKSFKEYLDARRNERDKQLEKIETSLSDLKKESVSKELFDAYWQSYKQDKADRESRDKLILDQLQRISR